MLDELGRPYKVAPNCPGPNWSCLESSEKVNVDWKSKTRLSVRSNQCEYNIGTMFFPKGREKQKFLICCELESNPWNLDY